VHNRHYDEAFFVTKFITGLKKEIQRAIRLHTPRTVDAAFSLAEKQELILEEARADTSAKYKHDFRHSFSRHGEPSKGVLDTTPDQAKKSADRAPVKPAWDSRFQSLKAQRRAKGECFKCGDKYQPGHKCKATVPLNVVEELVELLQLSHSDADSDSDSTSSASENFMHISQYAMTGSVQRKSFRLQGEINGKQVLLLVDSGSCGSFISIEAVQRLGLETTQVPPMTVSMANGAVVTVDTAVKKVTCMDMSTSHLLY
jgi:hypothetical protein